MRSLPILPTCGVLPAVSFVLVATACANVYRGAAEVDPSDVPRGRLVATYARTGCTGTVAQQPAVYVDFVQGDDGIPFIVERDDSDTWLLVTNGRQSNGVLVFQAVRKSDPSQLREYRFAARGREPGGYFESERYGKLRGSKHRFETQAVGPTRRCDLIPVDPLTGAPLSTYGVQPASSGARGWGFDGHSFREGDRVLVDVGGRSVPAEVLQAPGHAYLVRFEEDGGAQGVWIDPARITGRLE